MIVFKDIYKIDKLNEDLSQISPKIEETILPVIVASSEAEFSRVGNDLVIKISGDTQIIHNYFINPSLLKTGEGLILSFDDIRAKLNHDTETVWLASNDTDNLSISVPAEQIGIVTAVVEGPITAQSKDGTIRTLIEGDSVYLYDMIMTATHSYVKITLNDDTLFQLGPHSRASLDKYVYDPSVDLTGALEMFISQGEFRYVSGKISGNNQGQHTLIKTPSANIGIRGSEIDAIIGEDGSTTVLHLAGLVTIISRYQAQEIIVYERGTSVYIPNDNISHSVNRLTEDQIQYRNQDWQVFGNSNTLEIEPLETSSLIPKMSLNPATTTDDLPSANNEPSSTPPNSGARHPFSPLKTDATSDEAVDDLVSETNEAKENQGLSETIEMDSPTAKDSAKDSSSHREKIEAREKANETEKSETESQSAEKAEATRSEIAKPGGGDILPPTEVMNPSTSSETITLSFAFDEDTQLTFDKDLTDVFSIENGKLTQIPNHGELVDNAEGTFTYIPTPNFNGEDHFTYTLNETKIIEVNLTINPVNDAPVATDDRFDLTFETTTTLDSLADDENLASSNHETPQIITPDSLLANDEDIDNNTLTIIEVRNPQNGTVSLNEGEIVFTPKSQLTTAGSFEYVVSDGEKTDVGQVELIFRSLPPGPEITLNEDESIEVIAAERELGQITLFELPGHGELFENDNGQFTYTPTLNFFGEDRFTYTLNGTETIEVKLTINSVNDAPLATDDTFSLDDDTTPVTINFSELLGNDKDVESESLEIIEIRNPQNGTVSFNEGDIVFTPNSQFTFGRFDYVISDGEETDVGQVNLVFKLPPVIDITLDEDEPQTIDIFTIVAEPSEFTLPEHGQLVENDDGTFIYTPNQHFNGTDHFTYTINEIETIEVNLTINPINDAPVATDDTLVLDNETTELTITPDSLLFNDEDVENEVLEIIEIRNSQNGTVSLHEDEIVFTPNSQFITGSFDYVVSDGEETDVGQVNLSREEPNPPSVNEPESTDGVILPVPSEENPSQTINQPPLAQPDHFFMTQAGITPINVLANDSDPEGSQPTITRIEARTKDGLKFDENTGEILFTPTSHFFEDKQEITFSYVIADNVGNKDSTTVTLSPFRASYDNIVTDNPTSIPISIWHDLLENDAYPLGQINIFANNNLYQETDSFVFSPASNFAKTGVEQLTYQLRTEEGHTVSAQVTLNLFQAESDKLALENPITTALLLRNDKIPESMVPTLAVLSNTAVNGQVIQEPNGNITFTPTDNFTRDGGGSFNYQITDAQGHFSTTQVKVTGSALSELLNPPPKATPDPETQFEPLFSTIMAQELLISADSLLTNDNYFGTATISDVNSLVEDKGTAELLSDGNVKFTPAPGFVGEATFEYTIRDELGRTDTAMVTIEVKSPALEPQPDDIFITQPGTIPIDAFILFNDSPKDGLTIIKINDIQSPTDDIIFNENTGEIIFTPSAEFFENKQKIAFSYEVTDNFANIANATVTLIPFMAVNDDIEIDNNTNIEIDNNTTSVKIVIPTADLLTNDAVLEGMVPTLEVLAETAVNGTIEQDLNGNLRFTPNTHFIQEGSGSFAYQITDSQGHSSEAKVTISLPPSPKAQPDPILSQEEHLFKTEMGQDLSILAESLLDNDSYFGNAIISEVNSLDKNKGTAELLPDGNVKFTPNPGFVGEAIFEYTIIDALERTDTATVTVMIESKNPHAQLDTATVPQNSELNPIAVLENDTGLEPLIIQSIQQPMDKNGTVMLENNQIFFTPKSDFAGQVSFEYTIADSRGATDSTSVLVTVTDSEQPIITLSDTIRYEARGASQIIDRNATVADPDSLDFAGGKFTVAITENFDRINDSLNLQNKGPITISGNEILYHDNPIGSITPFENGELSVKLTENATPVTTTALLQAVSYTNNTPTTSTETRIIEITLSDGDGGEGNQQMEITFPGIIARPDPGSGTPNIEVPLNTPYPLSADLLLANDERAYPDDILRISEISNRSPGVDAQVNVNGNEVQLFVDALVNSNNNMTFEYTVVNEKGNQATAEVTLTPSNVKEGTTGSDEFKGNDEIEIIFGKEGDDTFHLSLGPDILFGGNGDDTFLFNPNAAGVYLDGQQGNADTLSLNVSELSNQFFDLSTNNHLSTEQRFNLNNLEIIDLGENKGNGLRLNLQDVIDITDSNNVLKIDGDNTNQIRSTNQGWELEGLDSTGLYNHYTSGGAQLLIEQNIENVFIS
jgi:hypothetical protein